MKIIIITALVALLCVSPSKANPLISEFKVYAPPLCIGEDMLKTFLEINFNDPKSVSDGASTLSTEKQCKTYFHSNAWKDLDQMKQDGNPYWDNIDIIKNRAKKGFYLNMFRYNSLESGIVTFITINDKNYKGEGVIFPLLLVRERDGWRMTITHVGHGKDIQMFYEDSDFWMNELRLDEKSIREEFHKIRQLIKSNQ